MVRSEGNMSLKNPVTPPAIDPGTVRLAAQRLNHYVTPSSTRIVSFLLTILLAGMTSSLSFSWDVTQCILVVVHRTGLSLSTDVGNGNQRFLHRHKYTTVFHDVNTCLMELVTLLHLTKQTCFVVGCFLPLQNFRCLKGIE